MMAGTDYVSSTIHRRNSLLEYKPADVSWILNVDSSWWIEFDTLTPRQNGPIPIQLSKMDFPERKCVNFDLIFNEVYS